MSNFYYELDVESVLQCPVCYELPQNDIFLCKIGHHMCDRCRKRLPSCPTCQAALTSSRNFLAEALISKFSIFKQEGDTNTNKNQLNGNQNDSPVTHIRPNNNTLNLPVPSGSFRCMLEACRHREGMGASKLIPHIESVHSALFEKISNMGLFFLNLKILEDGYINCWISTAAPIKQANKFEYEIEFCKEEDNKKIFFRGKMASTLMNTNWLLKRARVFIIPETSHGLVNGNFFSLFVKIVYKPPKPIA